MAASNEHYDVDPQQNVEPSLFVRENAYAKGALVAWFTCFVAFLVAGFAYSICASNPFCPDSEFPFLVLTEKGSWERSDRYKCCTTQFPENCIDAPTQDCAYIDVYKWLTIALAFTWLASISAIVWCKQCARRPVVHSYAQIDLARPESQST
jgi:hypothetical protein